MTGRGADRPHAITILLSLLAAFISAVGVYVAYEKSLVPSPELLKAATEQRQQTPEEKVLEEAKRKQSLDEAALEAAKKNILGLWICTAEDRSTLVFVHHFDANVYADNTLTICNGEKWPEHKAKKGEIVPGCFDSTSYRFVDSTHVQVQHLPFLGKPSSEWDTYTVGLMADRLSQHIHSDNQDRITCVRK